MGPGLEVQTFDRRGVLGKRWYSRIVDTRNWATLYSSEAYNSAQARSETAGRMGRALGCPVVPERRKR